MDPTETGRQGQYLNCTVAGESYRAYLPSSLPPVPPLRLDACLDRMEKANQALGRLDGLATLLPDISLFLYFYVRKEALLSSQIEGTQSSFSDLLLYESAEEPGVPLDDVQEVSSYVAAMNHGLSRLKEGFPLSLRLLREIHGILLSKGRGAEKTPGEFRRSQNWIGGTRPGNAMFVPPPPERMMECLDNLERFWHDQYGRYPTLIKAALSHVQFETIHPFLDGNGRLGRLLITLLFCSEQVLSEPLLYLSLYFKTHRQRYYDLLQKVRMDGDWESWTEFFLEGVDETATQAVHSARRILDVFETDRKRLASASKASLVLEILKKDPVMTISAAATQSGLSFPTVKKAMEQMKALGIVRELNETRRRGRIFVYERYLQILQEGTEPLSG